MKILVSSTFSDLEPERAAAISAIERVEQAEAMERFPASDEAPRDECIRRVNESDAVVLIIGERYGSLDPVSGSSITELEYRTACERGLPIFAYLKVGDDGSWVSAETDPERCAKHEAFKRLVDAQQVRHTFHTPEELQIEILASLNSYAQRHGRVGVPGAAFQTPSQFFRKYLDPQRVFNHTFPLVGRRSYVNTLKDAPSLAQHVIILPGIGGMGKTKILQAAIAEMQNTHPDAVVCMLAKTAYKNADAKELPTGQLVIVVDDAHRVGGLGDLFTLAQQFSDRIHLVLATRPHGLRTLRQDLAFAGVDATDILELPILSELTHDDVVALAQEVIGTHEGARLTQLVAVSRDSPLITVIAGQLLARNQLNPALLAKGNTQEFNLHVLARFQEVVLGQVALDYSRDLVRKALQLVAALTPFDPESTEQVERAANFLAVAPNELLALLGALERDGTLLSRSGHLRIVPDVLSDYILQDACFMPSGQLTGFGQQILDTFGSQGADAMLENFAELDWRVSGGKGTGLLRTVWHDLREAYRAATYQERLSRLGSVARIAYYQPDEALGFVRLALEAPPPPDAATSSYFSEENIRHELAPILRDTAYYEEHLRESVALLWQIGWDDPRSPEKESDHPIHILQTLAGYMMHKPLRHNEIMLEWLEGLVRSDDAAEHRYSPLDILPALLQREGTETWTQGNSLMMSPFLVNPTTTAPLRVQALALLETLAQRGDAARRRKVTQTLMHVILRGIMGLGNFSPTAEQVAAWQHEDRIILRMIADLMEAEENPVIVVEVEDDLIVIREDPKQAAIAADVARVIEHLPTTTESTLIRYLRQGPIQRRLLTSHSGATVDPEALEAAVATELDETITAFFATYATPDVIKRELERLLDQLAAAGVTSTESYFIKHLCRREPEIMAHVCDLLVADPASRTVSYLPTLLTMLRERDVSHYVACLSLAERSGHSELRRMAAWALAAPTAEANEQERELAQRFALDPDRSTVFAGIQALTRFGREYDTAVFQTLEQIALDADGALADRICMQFDDTWGIARTRLPGSFISAFLTKLIPLASWTNLHEVAEFVEWVTAIEPEAAAQFYLARLAFHQQLSPDQRDGYAPIPYLMGTPPVRASAVSADEQERALRALRDHAPKASSRAERRELAQAFARVAGYHRDAALRVLREWADSGDADKVRSVALLLESVASDHVFANEAEVVHLLEIAESLGPEVLKQVEASLIMTATSGARGGWVGAPDTADVELRDRAAEVAAHYPQGHVAHAFYHRLHDLAVGSIDERRRVWEVLDDQTDA